jgi:hypothetical protein
MMVHESEQPGWSLKSFLDSLTLELDSVQDTLAVKSVNRRLTYTVKDVALELQLFPAFDGEELRFTTAKPGETGAAKINFQLGSITDRQIRETAGDPLRTDDVAIEQVDGLDDKTKSSLKKIGVTSARDLERIEREQIDISKVSEQPLDYRNLAKMIQRTRRRAQAPSVKSASLTVHGGAPVLEIEGEHLSPSHGTDEFPRAFLDGEEVPVQHASEQLMRLGIDESRLASGPGRLQIALDPYAVLRMNLKS